MNGSDLAAVFLRPRPDSDVASVIAVSGSGPLGIRQCNTISFFVPFVRYPDLLVVRAPDEAAGRASVLVAGYFGIDWSLEKGELAWKAEE